MFKILNKDTKQAVVVAVIGMIVALIGFLSNVVYGWMTSAPKLQIARIWPVPLRDFHLADTTAMYLRNDIPEDIYKKNLLDSIVGNLDKPQWTQDEVAFAQKYMPLVINDCGTGIDMCNNKMRNFFDVYRDRHPEPGDLRFLRFRQAYEICKGSTRSIYRFLGDYLDTQQKLKRELECLYAAIKSCRFQHSNIWQFKLDILNTGDKAAYIDLNAAVQMNGQEMPYLISNSIKDGIPCSLPVYPSSEKGPAVVWLKPDADHFPDARNASGATEKMKYFEVILKTTTKEPVRKVDSLELD